jgi:hypothetical protein
LKLLHAAAQRRQRRFKSDLIEAIGVGYAGCKSKDGGKAAQRLVELLRE